MRQAVLGVIIISVGFSFSLQAANQPPTASPTVNPPSVYYSSTAVISANASDPDGDSPLTYTWTPSTGRILGSGPVVTYEAPLWAGKATITLKVDDLKGGTTTQTITIPVDIAQYSTQIGQGLEKTPARITTDSRGNIYVTDSRQRKVRRYNPLGGLELTIEGLRLPSGIAVDDAENIYVVDQRERAILIYNPSGQKIGSIGGPEQYTRPNGIAIKDERIYVADDRAKVVKVYDTQTKNFFSFGSGQLSAPTGIKIDKDKVYVADGSSNTVKVYSLDGNLSNPFALQTPQPSKVTGSFIRIQGLALDNRGYFYGVDTTWGVVQTFIPSGTNMVPFRGDPFFGKPGTGVGELKEPVDAVVDCFGRLLVTNQENGRIEIWNLKDAQAPRIIPKGLGAAKVVEPDTEFRLREYYVFPNPAKRGKKPTVHLECGIADQVEIKIYNVAAELVHSVVLDGKRKAEGGRADFSWCSDPGMKRQGYYEWADEYPWDISDIASGVYVAHIRASKVGYPEIKVLYKFSVIK